MESNLELLASEGGIERGRWEQRTMMHMHENVIMSPISLYANQKNYKAGSEKSMNH